VTRSAGIQEAKSRTPTKSRNGLGKAAAEGDYAIALCLVALEKKTNTRGKAVVQLGSRAALEIN